MLFEPVESKWHVTSALNRHWPRTDFLDQTRQEAQGIPPIGAAGDFFLGQESSKLATSNGQLQRLVRDLINGGTKRIQGIKVARTQPTNGQVLTYDAATGYYVPTTPTPPPGSAAASMGGAQWNQTFNLTPAEPLVICAFGGQSLVAVTGLEKLNVYLPFAGTLKNLYFQLSATGPTTYTINVLVNGATTALTASGTVSVSGTISLNDLTHTVAVTAGETVELQLSVAPAETGTVNEIYFGLEYDKT